MMESNYSRRNPKAHYRRRCRRHHPGKRSMHSSRRS